MVANQGLAFHDDKGGLPGNQCRFSFRQNIFQKMKQRFHPKAGFPAYDMVLYTGEKEVVAVNSVCLNFSTSRLRKRW